jgi:ABC-type transport system involved in multi-copper enzyme maturation permease subunit
MFSQLLQFELNFYRKQLSLYIALFVFLFLGFMVTGRLGISGKVLVNSPHVVASVYIFLSLLTPILIGLLSANSLLREDMHQSSELVYSTPITRTKLLFSRYLSLVFVVSIILLASGLAMMLRTHFPWGIDGVFADNQIVFYTWAFAIFVLPNIILCSAISFATACFSRSVMATYLSGLAIYLLYFLTSMFVGSPLVSETLPSDPSMRQLAGLADPFGLSAFEVATQYWTTAERNTQMVSLSGDLLTNRMIWMAISVLILLVTWSRFQLNLDVSSAATKKHSGWKNILSFGFLSKHENLSNKRLDKSSEYVAYQPMTPSTHSNRHWFAMRSSFGLEISHLLKSVVFWGIVILWSIFLIGEISPISLTFEFSSPRYMMTSRVLERFQYDLLPRFVLFVVVFYAAEMVWREKDLKMQGFIDASPANSSVFFISKFVALSFIPLFLISIAIIIGILNQLAVGYYDLQPLLYLSLYFYGGLPLIMNIVLCLFVNAIAPNRYLGMLISVVLLLFLGTNLSALVGLEHGLWHFASAPSFRYSDMNGSAHYYSTFTTYMFYWGCLTIVLGALGFALWRRGTDISLSHRFGQLKVQLGKKGIALVSFAIVGFLSSGSYIFYKTNIAANYYSSEDSILWRVNYEQQLKQYENLPVLNVTDIKTQVDLYPSERRFEASGEYRLENLNQQAVQQVLISIASDLSFSQLDLFDPQGNKATLIGDYQSMGSFLFRFENAIRPGETARLNFMTHQQQSGFGGFANNSLVTEHATMLFTSNKFPRLGYVRERELSSPLTRQDHGLPEKAKRETIYESVERLNSPSNTTAYDRPRYANFETIVSTTNGQTAVSHGSLVKQWNSEERSYFQYKTSAPIRNALFYLSSAYQIDQDATHGVTTKVYYDPRHQVNVKRMTQAIKDSLAYHIENFGAYPHKEFKHVETADFTGVTGFGSPTMTLNGEHMGFSYDLRNSEVYDQVYRRTAHEVAHQWWGHIIAPANTEEGTTLLVETLARYTETMIMKKIFGEDVALKFVKFEMGRYFRGRARETEQELPLYRSLSSQNYLNYSKGVVAMYALQNTIGEATLNSSLKILIERHAFPKKPATSFDLLEILYQVAPEHRAYIDQWFKRINYIEAKIENSSVQRQQDNSFELAVEIIFAAKEVDSDNIEKEVDKSTSVEVALTYSQDGEVNQRIENVELRSGSNRLNFQLQYQPLAIELDPRSLLLNKNKFEAKVSF